MQFLISVLNDRREFGTPEEQSAIDVFNERLQADGHWIYAGGLGFPESATVIDNRGDKPMFVDGPFIETKEFLAGFWIIDVPDSETALRLGAEGSEACNRRVEVRPFLRPEDVPQ